MKIYDNFLNARNRLRLFTILMLLSCSSFVSAESFTPDDLTRLVTGWAIQQTQHLEQASVEVFPLDARQAARDCAATPVLSWVSTTLQTQNSVKIQCDGEQPWQLYVNVRVTQQVSVLVSQRQLPSGSYVSLDDVTMQTRDVRQARGQYLTDANGVVGARLKRSVTAGQLLKLSDFCLVCKGDQVTIEGVSGTLAVSTTGKALADATLGEFVRVQNNQSGRVVEAQVTAVKKVTINL